VTRAEALLSAWEWIPLPAIVLLAVAAAYVAATVRVDHLQPFQPWPGRPTVCFLAGIIAMSVAILGPPGSFDDVFFYAHMTQHILLTMVAAPLLVLGEPILLSLRVAPRVFRHRWLVPLYRSSLVRLLMHPVFGWLLFIGVMAGSHIPAVYDYALSHPLAHDYIEHPLYVASALVYFYPLLAASPGPHPLPHGIRALSLFTMMIPMAMIGFFIYVAPQLGYPFYAHVSRPFGPAPFEDQQLSGAVMWSSTMAFGALWLCVAGLRWLHAEERRSHSVDRAIARSLTGGRKPARRRLWT
jgi:putative copper resistance protein D